MTPGRPESGPLPRPRVHDTFAVLRRAGAAVRRADLAVDTARETILHGASRRRERARRDRAPALDEATVARLRAGLG